MKLIAIAGASILGAMVAVFAGIVWIFSLDEVSFAVGVSVSVVVLLIYGLGMLFAGGAIALQLFQYGVGVSSDAQNRANDARMAEVNHAKNMVELAGLLADHSQKQPPQAVPSTNGAMPKFFIENLED